MQGERIDVAPGTRWTAASASRFVLPLDWFHELVRSERRRVDHDGGCFALVVWNLGKESASEEYCGYISRRIRQKMRVMDSIGWLDDSRIAVLLPATGLRECMALPVLARDFFEKVLWYPGGWDGRYALLDEKGL